MPRSIHLHRCDQTSLAISPNVPERLKHTAQLLPHNYKATGLLLHRPGANTGHISIPPSTSKKLRTEELVCKPGPVIFAASVLLKIELWKALNLRCTRALKPCTTKASECRCQCTEILRGRWQWGGKTVANLLNRPLSNCTPAFQSFSPNVRVHFLLPDRHHRSQVVLFRERLLQTAGIRPWCLLSELSVPSQRDFVATRGPTIELPFERGARSQCFASSNITCIEKPWTSALGTCLCPGPRGTTARMPKKAASRSACSSSEAPFPSMSGPFFRALGTGASKRKQNLNCDASKVSARIKCLLPPTNASLDFIRNDTAISRDRDLSL